MHTEAFDLLWKWQDGSSLLDVNDAHVSQKQYKNMGGGGRINGQIAPFVTKL